MLLKYFYDSALAHASYMVGCQRAKVAVVVDPGRDIEQYLEMATREDLKLIAVAETHIHADYVSGARELADRVGAKLYVSDEGPAEWKYLYADQYDHQLVKDGGSFMIGNIQFDVLHTPGHTPESISFLLTDQGGGANKPMGIFTGDFVFVGSIGRPDLLEAAAGLANTAEPGARDLFQSAERFKQLPDYLQVWPAHGAGSGCGKGLGPISSSTVGYEKLFNPTKNGSPVGLRRPNISSLDACPTTWMPSPATNPSSLSVKQADARRSPPAFCRQAGREVINMIGGFGAWNAAGLGVDRSEANAACDAGSACV